MPKSKIYFIPQYIGPLKYFERFIPYLKITHDVGFLFISRDDTRRRELIKYCEERGYPYSVIDKGLKGATHFGIHIPFFTPIKNRYDHIAACRSFLKTVKPTKIIAPKSKYPNDIIFKEANRAGIETIVLQWSLGLFTREILGAPQTINIFKKIYFFILNALFFTADMFYKESRFGFAPAVPKKIGVFTKIDAQKHINEGHDPQSIFITGSPDFQTAYELKKKIDSNSRLRPQLLEKYSLRKNKTKIFVNLFRFHILPIPHKYKLTPEQHIAHHQALLESIRSVFNAREADIILKVHPSEHATKSIYDSYKKFDIKIYSNESQTDELLCLSDLYVGDPTSSLNYMLLASGIPAIFTNFSEFDALNDIGRNTFYVKHTVTDLKEFQAMLHQFKKGLLSPRYDNSNINLKSVDAVISLIQGKSI